MIKSIYRINCDICNYTEETMGPNQRFGSIYDALRSAGWAVSRDRVTCFCPKCKKLATSTGRNGNNRLLPLSKKRKEQHAELLKEFKDIYASPYR